MSSEEKEGTGVSSSRPEDSPWEDMTLLSM